MSSMFNPEAFMNSTISDANSSQYNVTPEGEFKGVISKIEVKTVGADNKPVINVTWKIDDEGVRNETGLSEPIARQTIWLDVTEQGGLDMGKGKNVGLGKLREALGQNQPGKPWMPGMLEGGVALVKIKHSIDKRDNVTIQANVNGVTKLG